MLNTPVLVSLIIPCFNEKNSIESTIIEIEQLELNIAKKDKGDEVNNNIKEKTLSDHDKYKSAQMQFYGFLTSSVAIWAYNLYDVRKLRYNYADNGKNRFNISFTPDRQVSLQIKF